MVVDLCHNADMEDVDIVDPEEAGRLRVNLNERFDKPGKADAVTAHVTRFI